MSIHMQKFHVVLQVLEGGTTASIHSIHLEREDAERAINTSVSAPMPAQAHRTSRYFIGSLDSIEAVELMPAKPEPAPEAATAGEPVAALPGVSAETPPPEQVAEGAQEKGKRKGMFR